MAFNEEQPTYICSNFLSNYISNISEMKILLWNTSDEIKKVVQNFQKWSTIVYQLKEPDQFSEKYRITEVKLLLKITFL